MSFDEGYEVWGVFRDISKIIDEFWHEGLIFKLKWNEISGKLLHLIKEFLSDRNQLVVLNGQCSSWMEVQAGVSQGSILRLYVCFFFLIYVNNLPDNVTSNPKFLANNKWCSALADSNA